MDRLLDTLDLSPGIKVKINTYIDNLYRFDKSKRLIGSENKEKWVTNHIEDTIKAYNTLKKPVGYYDMGSGNGLPGLIFSILDDSLPITLVDNDKKKIEFLKTMIYRLKVNAHVFPVNIQEINLKTVPRGTVFLYRAFSPREAAYKFIKNNRDYEHVVFVSERQNLDIEAKETLKYKLSDGSSRKLLII